MWEDSLPIAAQIALLPANQSSGHIRRPRIEEVCTKEERPSDVLVPGVQAGPRQVPEARPGRPPRSGQLDRKPGTRPPEKASGGRRIRGRRAHTACAPHGQRLQVRLQQGHRPGIGLGLRLRLRLQLDLRGVLRRFGGGRRGGGVRGREDCGGAAAQREGAPAVPRALAGLRARRRHLRAGRGARLGAEQAARLQAGGAGG